MLYKKLSFIAAFCALIFSNIGCKKYEPLHEGAWTDAQADQGTNVPLVREIVYVKGTGIYITDRYNRNPKLVAQNTTYQNINHIVFSPKHDKIAFSKSTGNELYIIDTLGKTIVPDVPTPYYVDYFEWHSDNKLLYGLYGGKMKAFHGGALPAGLPPIPTNITPRQFGYITPENDLLYVYTGKFRYIKNGQTQVQEINTGGFAYIPSYFRMANGSNKGRTTHDFYYVTITNRTISISNNGAAYDTPLNNENYMREDGNGNVQYYLRYENKYDDDSTPIQTSVYDVK